MFTVLESPISRAVDVLLVKRSSGAFGPLIRTVFEAIIEVFLMCFAGWLLSWKRILDKRTQNRINRLNINLFTPCLLFSKVAFSLTPAKLRELWIVPILFVFVTVISALVAFVIATLMKLKRSQRNFAMAASMFNNSNSLPIALMQSLVVTVQGLKWGDDDHTDAMLGRALSYLILYSTMGMILRWSYGVRLLAQADEEIVTVTKAPQAPIKQLSIDSPMIQQRPGSKSYFATFPDSPADSQMTSPAETPAPSSPVLGHAYLPHETKVDEKLSDDVLEGSDSEWGAKRSTLSRPPLMSRFARAFRLSALADRARRFWRGFSDFMTMPLYAALASIIVAVIPPLQHFLDKKVQPVRGFLNSGGACSIPLTLVVLGAYFYVEPPSEEAKQQDGGKVKDAVGGSTSDEGLKASEPNKDTLGESQADEKSSPLSEPPRATIMGRVFNAFKMKGFRQRLRSLLGLRRQEGVPSSRKASKKPTMAPGESKTVLISVVSRMILTPAIVLPFLWLLAHFGLARPTIQDPVFVCSAILLISAPPALTLAQLTQAASGDAFERLVSSTIFWSYCVFTPPLTLIYVIIALRFPQGSAARP